MGFDLCGIVRAERFPELEKFREWLSLGYAGEMKYLEDPRRTDPSLIMQDLTQHDCLCVELQHGASLFD